MSLTAEIHGDLDSLGFDAEWGVLSAGDVGASHGRERIWILGSNSKWKMADSMLRGCNDGQAQIDTAESRVDALGKPGAGRADVAGRLFRHQWQAEPRLGRVVDGMAYRMERLKAIGNGQVPQCAAAAFNMLRERMK